LRPQEADRQRTRAAKADLVASGAVEPLVKAPGSVGRWMDCDLASLVENRFHLQIGPDGFTSESRREWHEKALRDHTVLTSPFAPGSRNTPYWIVDAGEQVGTVALDDGSWGGGWVGLSSLYVFPSHRRRGAAARCLRQIRASLEAHDLSLRLSTEWAWQPAVRFYLEVGLWVANWKESLIFAWPRDLPDYRLVVSEENARLETVGRAPEGVWLEASREGRRLILERSPKADSHVLFHAVMTLSVALAVRGWPLIRSAAEWKRRLDSADGGYPEGLAYKILLFEAADRKCGFDVRTPRIPALRYASDEELRKSRRSTSGRQST
jgi:GNAT superfamily N-acetyltransferase